MTPTSVQLYSHLQIRTTGEPVFVLDAGPQSGFFLVRRPIQTRDGLQHVQENFHAEELESAEDGIHREIDQLVERHTYSMRVEKQTQFASQPGCDKPQLVKPN